MTENDTKQTQDENPFQEIYEAAGVSLERSKVKLLTHPGSNQKKYLSTYFQIAVSFHKNDCFRLYLLFVGFWIWISDISNIFLLKDQQILLL